MPDNSRPRRLKRFTAAAILVIITLLAAAFFYSGGSGYLVLKNEKTGEEISRYALRNGDSFSIGFIHSVNNSPVTDYYELRKDGIHVVKTVYYGFGAGVQTELEEGQKLEYGEDGSMIITGFNRGPEEPLGFVGTVSDHILTLIPRKTLIRRILAYVTGEGKDMAQSISLRDLCGRSALVRFMWINHSDCREELYGREKS